MKRAEVFGVGFNLFKSPATVKCPLCGSTESYGTNGSVPFTELTKKLAKVREWIDAHAASGGITGIPDEVAKVVGDPRIPDLDPGAGGEHRRCGKCKTLLPPQFWREGPASSLAMTVAGASGHGKTTWLMSVLTAPRNSRYSIVGFNERHAVEPYDYVDPYTIKMLSLEFRTSIPFLLMGCTISYADMLVDVRTLDVRGEWFETNLPEVRQRVGAHLTARRGGGAMLIVERFTGNQAERIAPIAQAYLSLSLNIRAQQRRGDVLWKAVVWTFLDRAEWRPEGERFLRRIVTDPGPLVRLASNLPRYDSPDVLTLYDEIRGSNDLRIRELLNGVRSADVLAGPELEAMAALLFRLQLLYCAAVARRRLNRLEYLYAGEGRLYVRFCQELAKQLYLHWDAPLGGIGTMLTGGDEDDDWQVIPCGRIVEPNMAPESVWNDQIVIEAIARVGMR